MMATEVGMGTVILATGILVGRSLLAARIWARWVAVVLFMLLAVSSLMGMFGVVMAGIALAQELPKISQEREAAQADGREVAPLPLQNFMYGMVAMYGVPLLAGLLLGIAGIWSLVSRKAGEWFAFAAQIRWEHRQMRAQFH